MYSMSKLVQEIREITDSMMRDGISVNPDWATKQIIDQHNKISGDDADFYLCTSRETVRDQVRKQLNRFKLSLDKALITDPQIVLPGFERLQRAYLIDIGDQQIAVPIEKMSYQQRQNKVAELRAMGAGCYQHANELERYNAEHPNLAA